MQVVNTYIIDRSGSIEICYPDRAVVYPISNVWAANTCMIEANKSITWMLIIMLRSPIFGMKKSINTRLFDTFSLAALDSMIQYGSPPK